jgi:phospholipid/cholesterol/gamma-HCH transport system substrate-binding protein
MKLLDKKTSLDATKLLVFLLVTSLATGVLVIMIGNLSFKSSSEYKAQFVDVTGVLQGDDVRIAGVKVGAVKDVEVVDRDRALVTFSVEDGVTLSDSTFATIRFRNLVGQRYISLSEEVGDTSEMEPGDTIPVERTKPALDLTLLFNGFKPLFQALSPDDINQISYEIVQVFQGEGGTLESLLRSTASVTSTLADRDQVIGDLLKNLDYVLDRLADRDTQLNALITSFRKLVGGLKTDRAAILDSIEGISRLSVETADLVRGIRPPFVEDIKQLRRFARITDENKGELDRALQVLPIKLNKVGRTAINGSWFNFYLCTFKGKVTLPGLNQPIYLPSQNGYQNGASRCDLGGSQ